MTTPEENVADALEQQLEMTSEIQTISACERRIKVAIPHSEVERYFQNEFTDLEKTAYVPGFRVGKSPRKLVEKRFKKEVGERVKNALVVDALSKFNDSSELTPISEPDFDYNSLVLSDDGPFVFEFAIEVRPEFELPEWRGLKITKPVREFTKEDIDKAVERVLTTFGTLETKDAPAEPGDYIEAKLTFKSGEQVLSQFPSETICLRSTLSFHDGSIENFAKLMTGVKSGDVKTIETTLTEDAANPDFRGKAVEAVFEIVDVKNLKLPKLTERFLEKLGGFDNEADFRDAVLDSLERQLMYEQDRRTRRQIAEALTISASWELPRALLARQADREFRRTIMELQRSGYNNAEIRAQLNFLRQNSAAETARALKEHFILERIAEVENVEDTPDDYDVEIALIAAQQNTSPRRVRAQIEKAGEMDILRNQVIERKVINMISENAVFTETPFEFEERDVEAMDISAAGDPNAIAEVTQEDLKAVHQEIDQKRKEDPNAKIK